MKIWHQMIAGARSREELLRVVRDYIASFTPEEWASIPASCRPDRIKGIDDLAFWHERLAEEYLAIASVEQGSSAHRAMLGLFTAATERGSGLFGVVRDDGASDDPDPLRTAAPKQQRRQQGP